MKSRKRAAFWAIGGLALALLVSACSQGVSQEVVDAKDREIATLKGQLTSVQQDATYWQQLNSVMMPVELKSMTDHKAYMLPSGVIMALHFDNMDLKQAKNLNWLALGIPGKFCKSDQERLDKQYGPGFTHFHDLMNDTHGGKPGAEGVWFVHNAVRDFDATWGRVKPGVDDRFMPTPAPAC